VSDRVVEVREDREHACRYATAVLATAIEHAVEERGRADIAVSGGSTPRRMLELLAGVPLPWADVHVFQVDERIAPHGDRARNANAIIAALGGLPACLHLMPVTAGDLDAAARRYAAQLPESFDVVHLGLGSDGHTASLVPGDPVVDVRDRRVALTAPYEGHHRMTLTRPVLDAARLRVWLVTGEDKAPAVERLLAGDPDRVAARIRASASMVILDRAAAGR
jgi:6-phosphogluconolactonase